MTDINQSVWWAGGMITGGGQNPLAGVYGMDLVGFVVPRQDIHHEVHAEPKRHLALLLALPAAPDRVEGAAVRPRRFEVAAAVLSPSSYRSSSACTLS